MCLSGQIFFFQLWRWGCLSKTEKNNAVVKLPFPRIFLLIAKRRIFLPPFYSAVCLNCGGERGS